MKNLLTQLTLLAITMVLGTVSNIQAQYDSEILLASGHYSSMEIMDEERPDEGSNSVSPEEPKKLDPVQVNLEEAESTITFNGERTAKKIALVSPQEPEKKDYIQENHKVVEPIEVEAIDRTIRTNTRKTGKSNHQSKTQTQLPEEKIFIDLSKLSKTSLAKNEKGKKRGDGLIYLITALMGLTSLGFLTGKRSKLLKLTRWAKAKPRKSQGLITGLQLLLAGLGILGGHNLNQMGFELSDASIYVFSAVALLGLMSVPFLPKRGIVAIPRKLNRHRMGFLGTSLAFLMAMTGFGNKLVDKYPDTFLANAVEAIDQSVFPTNSDETTASIELGAVESTNQGLRGVLGAGACALAVLLIILLVATTCGGICLVIGGFGSGSVGLGALGLLVTFLSIWGIISVAKWCKQE